MSTSTATRPKFFLGQQPLADLNGTLPQRDKREMVEFRGHDPHWGAKLFTVVRNLKRGQILLVPPEEPILAKAKAMVEQIWGDMKTWPDEEKILVLAGPRPY